MTAEQEPREDTSPVDFGGEGKGMANTKAGVGMGQPVKVEQCMGAARSWKAWLVTLRTGFYSE